MISLTLDQVDTHLKGVKGEFAGFGIFVYVHQYTIIPALLYVVNILTLWRVDSLHVVLRV